MKIAIQGELGSFSHQAALRFAPQAEISPCMQAFDAVTELENGECDAAALPIENTLAGSVVEHYDLLLTRPVHIERETILRIAHCLIGMPGSVQNSIHRVYSHPVALAQCRRFLAGHPEMEAIPFYDTAGAVKQIIKLRERHSAAIAGEFAARMYEGEVLATDLEDDPENYTRFLLLRPGAAGSVGVAPPPSGPHKLSVTFEVEHRPGTVASAFTTVAEAGGNITKLQSRPIAGQPWFYTFALDCLVADTAASDRILAELATRCIWVKELGRYLPAEDASAEMAA